MVVEVRADAGGVDEDVDRELLQVLAGADAREHEQLRGVDRAGAEDDLAAGDDGGVREQVRRQVVDADRAALLVEEHLAGPAVRADLEVRPAVDDRVQIGVRRRHPRVVGARVDLEPARAVGHRVTRVEGRRRQAGLRRRLEDGHAAGVLGRDRADVHRPVAAVVVAGGIVGLQALDERPALVRAPARVAHRGPLVEILARRPEGDARVVRRAPAQHLGAGVAQERVALLLGLDEVVPVVARVQEVHPVLEAQDRVVVDVRRACLDEADPHVRILRQPRRDDAPGGPAAGDDVVELVSGGHGATSAIAGCGRSSIIALCSARTSIGVRL